MLLLRVSATGKTTERYTGEEPIEETVDEFPGVHRLRRSVIRSTIKSVLSVPAVEKNPDQNHGSFKNCM